MRNRSLLARLTLLVLAVGLLAAAVSAIAGGALTSVYRPRPPGSGLDFPLTRTSDRWVDVQRFATVIFLVATIGILILGAWQAQAQKHTVWRRVAVVAGCAVAAAMAMLTLLTQELVAWDQIALRSVTVGSNLSGYWVAAFGGDIRFVLINGVEVSQSEYGFVLLVHLAAPFVGLIALVGVGVALLLVKRAGEPTTAG